MNTQTIYLAGGCFWGLEAYFKAIPGVISVDSGYANGPTNTTTYEEVCHGSGHAETIKLIYDADV
ncbi:MAG: bifunctional peptide-methionine (S)-S-oxide reductase MsrA/peptide-methionine (R)-S-oxide reductase MsrB, partial [Negativicutes bacterium]|nr:bifunctional peptide-methionine (S)-S-oxide reductase MsrA/peptide-methionine (R)-S-oxide reductase MsrB [Negativicutes bacterium]